MTTTTRTRSVWLTCAWCNTEFNPISGRTKTQRYCSTTCRDNGSREPIREMSETEIAWLAGFFDGEGHISVRAQLSQRATGVKIQVTNTNHALLERVAEFTGVGYITTRPRQSAKWKTTYDWHTTGGNAKALLVTMLPWLIEKRERALEAIG